tara:strand:- start:1034 stop:1408 length:375 start_codon:yes stop_codon:yes gene_type:complete
MVRPRQISINNVMVEYYSNYSWGMTGPNYSDIVWKSNPEDMPSIEVLEEKRVILQQLEPLRFLREKRNILLTETDWRATVDYPGSDKQSWLDYRKALRDLPTTAEPELDDSGNLVNVTWPEVPE